MSDQLDHDQLLTNGVEPFLRSRQMCSHSRTSQRFMEPEGSLLCSQEPSTDPYPEPDRSSLYHLILSILILSTHLHLGLPSGLFLSGFPTNILYAVLFSPIRATCPAHLTPLDLIILIMSGEDYKSSSFSLCSFLQPPVASSLFGPNILLSTLYSNTVSPCSSLNVRDQVLHPCRTTGKIMDHDHWERKRGIFHALFYSAVTVEL
jgi:hypothetical protein